MTIYLVRHAKAGRRGEFADPDWLRPLTQAGQQQARGLLIQMHTAKFQHIVSSPYVRCMETVVPLASNHGLAIEPHDALAEESPLDVTMQLVGMLEFTETREGFEEANRVHSEIHRQIENLAHFPGMGRSGRIARSTPFVMAKSKVRCSSSVIGRNLRFRQP